MESKDLRGLMEAYAAVYAPQEVDEATAMAKRGYDETKLRQRAGGGEAADRASELEKKSTFGDANKAKQRQNYARAQRGDFRKTSSSNPGLHVGQHKSDDPAVKAKQAARGAQRGALTPNERKQLNMGDETFDVFDIVLEFLQSEGFAETLEEAEWMMANMIDEEAIDIILGEASRRDEFTRAAIARNSGRKGGITFEPGPNWDPSANRGKGAHLNPKQKEKQRRKALRQEEFVGEEELDEAITSEKGKAKAAEMIAKRTHASGRAKSGQGDNVAQIKHIGRANVDNYYGTPPNRKIAKNPVKSTAYLKGHGAEGKGNKAAKRAAELRQEEYVGEAQEARNNPEKYEREQAKKSAPVRGERTPMPPRGDKRREDFEKWYAKQMGR
jgi:hypothetical protein